MLTSAKLIPEDIYGCVYSGELAPIEAYQVIVDQWHEASFCGMASADAPEPEPILIEDIPQNKYTIFQHQTERLQIILGLTDSNYYLSGSVYLEIETDSGRKLVSGPHKIALCVPDKYSFEDTLGVSSVAFSPAENLLAAGYNDGSVILWDTSSNEPISGPLAIHSSPVKRLAFTPNGQLLASGSQYGEIFLSTLNDLHTVVGPLVDDMGMLHSLAISPQGNWVASGSDGSITIWDVESGQVKTSFNNDSYADILDLTFSQDGTKLAAGDREGGYYLWDIENAVPIMIISPPEPANYSSLDIHLDSNRLIAASPITLLNISSAGYNAIHFEQENTAGMIWGDWVSGVVFNNSGTQIASVKGNQIMLWEPNKSQQTGILFNPYIMDYLSLTYNNQDNILASGSMDGSIILWDVVNEKILSKLIPLSNAKPMSESSPGENAISASESDESDESNESQVLSQEEIYNNVVTIIIDLLCVDESIVTPEARFYEDLGADELDSVELIMAYEDKFNILISDEDAMQILTVGDAVDLVERILISGG